MIIVTGGAGFVGRNIIKKLNEVEKKEILVVDNLSNGKKYRNLMNLDISDYLDKDYFINKLLDNPSYFKNIEVVFHEGACSNTREWNGKYLMKNNYEYSKLLLFYCIKYEIPFIYASSASVYGSNMCNVYCRNNKIINSIENPVTMYGYSKFLFDRYVHNILPKVKSQVCGLRYFNIYGPHEFHKGRMASVILNIYKKVKNKESPILFVGSKNFKRDFVYIDDIVNVNLWIWYNKISGIFDCGTGHARSFEFVTSIVLNLLNYNTIKYVTMPKEIQKYYQYFTKANISQLQGIGYENKFIDVNEGIYKYLNWLNLYMCMIVYYFV
ncbi:ADP-L-glycero-D-manno-heptose-6-epimerase [Candidatus Blochmanniella vafra str. BVAF]|uniref:ADP-L-glycero-D-manno-heptose-6-epimerase n=1 Tax=Blochmanniella vafra (strain BVAF) TaxID=859654 RepID=E8Q786_BLOVB|nr:ADP-glyceromanno-heptose 6-epimerase [Candidatus Blochmannia vafer]ADV33981.1 ADP-L-glycero-D-manno-heptose-6-epimerase [Candidatus Blochmannia vafer str. BVAF]